MKWKVYLEEDVTAVIRTEMGAKELATELMEFGGDGYVYDEDVVIPVRRIICMKLVLDEA